MGKVNQILADFVGMNEREVPEVPETSEETKSEIQKVNENLGKLADLLTAKAEAEATEAKADTVEVEKADIPKAKEPEAETVEGKETETETVEVKEPDAVEEAIEPETVEPEAIESEATEKSEVDKAKTAAGNVEEAIKANSETVEGKETETETVEVKEPDAAEETVEPEIAEPKPEPEPEPEPTPEPEQLTSEPEKNTGQLPKELEDYILEDYIFKILDRRPDLIDKVIEGRLDEYLARNISEIPRIDETIRHISDENVEIGLRFVHTRTNEQYSSWSEAVESIREITEIYGVKPEDFFKKQYFRIDQPEKEIPEDEVRKYISSFRGNRKKLYKKLQIEPKKQN